MIFHKEIKIEIRRANKVTLKRNKNLTEDWLLITTDFSSWSIGATSGSLTNGSGAGGEAGEAVVLFSEFPAKRASLFRRICKRKTKRYSWCCFKFNVLS